jgi:hypothetical protein
MSFSCILRHHWEGCTCTRCGKTRDEFHVFKYGKQDDIIKCELCGNEKHLSNQIASGYVYIGTTFHYFAACLNENGGLQWTGLGTRLSEHFIAWPNVEKIFINAGNIIGIDKNNTVFGIQYSSSSKNLTIKSVPQYEPPKLVQDVIPHLFGCLYLYCDGTIHDRRSNHNRDHNQATSGWTNIVKLVGNYSYCAGLTEDGNVFFAGDYSFRRDNVTKWNDIVNIYGSSDVIIGIKSNGAFVATSDYYNDILSDFRDFTKIALINQGKNGCHVLNNKGRLISIIIDNTGEEKKTTKHEIGSDFIDVSEHIAVRTDGSCVAIYPKSADQLSEVNKWSVF